jgi:hypothetical protein
MSAFSHYLRYIDVTTCCAFCSKSLPIVNGEMQPWRASSGQFFCDEFCADDAEEVCFQRHGRAHRMAHDRVPLEAMR